MLKSDAGHLSLAIPEISVACELMCVGKTTFYDLRTPSRRLHSWLTLPVCK